MRILWLIIFLIILFAVLSGSAFAYFRPQAVLDRALENAAETHYGKYTAVLGLDNTSATEQLLGEPATLEFIADGTFDRSPGKRSSVSTQLAVTAKTDTLSLRMIGEARLIGDEAYINLVQVPSALTALAPFKGRWISLNRGGTQDTPNITQNEQEIFTSVNYAGRETLNNESVVKYTADATPESAVRMFDQVASILGTNLTSEQTVSLRQNLATMEDVSVQLWVNPLKSQLRRISAHATAPNGNAISFEVGLIPLQTAPSIATPENAVTWEQIVSTLPAQR